MGRDRKNIPADDALDLNDPIVQDFLQKNGAEDIQANLRELRAAIEASEQAGFLCPRDQEPRDERPEAVLADLNSDRLGRDSRPRELGPYTLEKQIGRGGFSHVFEAVHKPSSRRVAVKVFSRRTLDAVERLDIERMVLQKLDHPNLVSVIDFGQTVDGTTYLVMPLIDGIRIHDYAESNSLSHRQIALLFTHVALALQYAHERGIIHRDLKPGNILVTRQGVPIVTDFGLAKLFPSPPDDGSSDSSITATGAILGTLGYLAPEQIVAGDSEITRAVDIYGLGATRFRVLVGQPPNESRHIFTALRESHLRRPAFPAADRRRIPSVLRAICLKCLEISPEDRYGSMKEIHEDLTLFAEGKPVRIRRVPWASRMRRWIQSEPLTSALYLCLASAILIGLIATLGLWRAADRERNQVKEMLATAREILNDGDRVAEGSLVRIPGTLEFRLQRLEKSSDFFDRLLARYPNDTALIKDCAVSNFRAANVSMILGKHEMAHLKLNKAEVLFQRLTEIQPGNPDHRFDLFHCALTRSYLHPDLGNRENLEPIKKADQIVTSLVTDFPDDPRFLDALLCTRIQTLDYRNPADEKSFAALYQSATKLKSQTATPCLEWRHAGSCARLLAMCALERLDLDQADYWLPIAKDATLDFLSRPDSLPDDKIDWVLYIEAAAKHAYAHGDQEGGDKLRQQWRGEIEACIAQMPDRPWYASALENEKVTFDDWLSNMRRLRPLVGSEEPRSK